MDFFRLLVVGVWKMINFVTIEVFQEVETSPPDTLNHYCQQQTHEQNHLEGALL